MTVAITRQTIWDNAADLVSEDGENVEYDRAITELVSDLFGYGSDDRPALLKALQLRQQQRREPFSDIDPTTGDKR